MQKLQAPSAATPGSRPASGTAVATRRVLPQRYDRTNLPKAFDRFTDADIPRWAWSSWKADGTPRLIRQELPPNFRAELQKRRDDIAPVIEPYDSSDDARVTVAIADLLSGFPGKQDDEMVVARIDSIRRLLALYPAWAIEKVCADIRSKGFARDGKIDRRWAPTDPELCGMMDTALRMYRDAHSSAVALLAAEVEPKRKAYGARDYPL